MNEDAGHDPTAPTPPVDPTEPVVPVTPVETTASHATASKEPVGRTEAIDPVAVSDPGAGAGQVPPNLPPRPLAAEPLRRRSVAVPMWALAALGALLILGSGLLGGYAIGSEEGHGDREGHRSLQGDTRESDDSGSGSDGGNRRGTNAVPPRQVVPPTRVPRGKNGGQAPTRPQPASPTGAFLGVSVRDSTNPEGATLIQVARTSPAGTAGLKARDVITAVDATAIKSAAELTTAIRSQQPGARIVVTYTRDGARATANVTLGDRAQLRAQ